MIQLLYEYLFEIVQKSIRAKTGLVSPYFTPDGRQITTKIFNGKTSCKIEEAKPYNISFYRPNFA